MPILCTYQTDSAHKYSDSPRVVQHTADTVTIKGFSYLCLLVLMVYLLVQDILTVMRADQPLMLIVVIVIANIGIVLVIAVSTYKNHITTSDQDKFRNQTQVQVILTILTFKIILLTVLLSESNSISLTDNTSLIELQIQSIRDHVSNLTQPEIPQS